MMLSEKPRSPISEHRKVTKSAMEKKRRARINSSLTELKTILAGIMAYKDERFEKMEKADILEMTVNYVRELQNRSSGKDKHVHQDGDNYRTGVNSCISEVIRYVTASDFCDTDTKTKLLDHLANRVNDIPTTAKAAPAHSPGNRKNTNLKVDHDVGAQQSDVNNNVNEICSANKTSCLSVNTQNITFDTSVTQGVLGSPLRSCTQSPPLFLNSLNHVHVSQTQPNLISVNMSGQPQVLTNVSQMQSNALQNVPLTILVPANFCTTSNGTTCVIPLTLSNTGSESSIAINPFNVTNGSVKSAMEGVTSSDIGYSPNGQFGVNNGNTIKDDSHRLSNGQTQTERQSRKMCDTNDNLINQSKESNFEKCKNSQNGSEVERSEGVSENLLSTTCPKQFTLSRKSPSLINKDSSVWRPW